MHTLTIFLNLAAASLVLAAAPRRESESNALPASTRTRALL